MEGGKTMNEETFNSRVIVFVGAGASAALNLPTTLEFVNQLEKRSPDSSSLLSVYRTNVSQVKRIREENVPIDSEYIRDWLEDMKFMAKSIEELEPVIKSMLHQKAPTASHVLLSVDSLIDWFDSQITKTYGEQFKPELAYTHYSPLLDILKQNLKIEVVPLFTTNYDLIFECMQDYPQNVWNVVTGMIQTGRGKLILKTQTFDKASSVPRLLIFKLHGSVDWWQNPETGEVEQVQERLQTPKEYKRALIYPTREKFGQIKEEPFSFFYKRLKAHLSSEEIRACITIGYSFRDKFINDIFAESLRKGLKLIIIDKSKKKHQLMAEFSSYELDSSIIENIRIHNLEFGNWQRNPNNRNRFTQILNDELVNDSNLTKQTSNK